jgi:hypothetical protein
MSDAAATCGKSLSVPELATLTGFAQDTIRGHLERGTDPRTLVVHAHTGSS